MLCRFDSCYIFIIKIEEEKTNWNLVILPRMSLRVNVLLLAQVEYAAVLGGMVHPKASPTWKVVCATELCIKAVTANTTRKTMFNPLAIAFVLLKVRSPLFSLALFFCSVSWTQSSVLFWRENSTWETQTQCLWLYVYIEGGHAVVRNCGSIVALDGCHVYAFVNFRVLLLAVELASSS